LVQVSSKHPLGKSFATSNNVVYIIASDDDQCQGNSTQSGVIRAWMGTGAQPGNAAVPTGYAEQDAGHHPVSAGVGDCTYNIANVLGGHEPVYAYKLGGPGNPWSSVAAYDPRSSTNPTPGDTCEPGLDGSANARFDPLRDNNAHIVDVIYYDERDNSDCANHHATLFYKAFVMP
jgi:hypothetical protein